MDPKPASSSIATKRATLTPRAAVERPRPRKRSKNSSLVVQRYYPPGFDEDLTSNEPIKRPPNNPHFLTWQEFVKDAFKSTVSLASVVSWHEVIRSPPVARDGDGPTEIPPEVRETLNKKKSESTFQKIKNSVQIFVPGRKKSSSSNPSASTSDTGRSSRKSSNRFGIFGKSKKVDSGLNEDINGNAKRRFSHQPKAMGEWASKTQKFFRRKKKSKKTQKSDSLAAMQVQEHHSSSTSSSSPTSERGLLKQNSKPSKIVVRRASRPRNLPSLFSSPTASAGSLVDMNPVAGWTSLASPEQAVSPSSSLKIPFALPSQNLPRQPEQVKVDPLHSSMSQLVRCHSASEAVFSSDHKEIDFSARFGPQRRSLTDSMQSHETLWRRSVSSPSITSSYSSLSGFTGWNSRNASVGGYRGSISSIPRGSSVSIQDLKRALRANLTGSLRHSSIDETKAPSIGNEEAARDTSNLTSDTQKTHTFNPDWQNNQYHLNNFRETTVSPDTSRPSTSRTERPRRDGRHPSVVKRDHMEIYNHPYFEVAPYERHQSLSSLSSPSRSRAGDFVRHATMDSMRSYRTAHDGAEDSSVEVSFSSF